METEDIEVEVCRITLAQHLIHIAVYAYLDRDGMEDYDDAVELTEYDADEIAELARQLAPPPHPAGVARSWETLRRRAGGVLTPTTP